MINEAANMYLLSYQHLFGNFGRIFKDFTVSFNHL